MFNQTELTLSPSLVHASILAFVGFVACYLLLHLAIPTYITLLSTSIVVLVFGQLIRESCFLRSRESIISLRVSDGRLEVKRPNDENFLPTSNVHSLLSAKMCLISVDIADAMGDNSDRRFYERRRLLLLSRYNCADSGSFRRVRTYLNLCRHSL